MERKIKILWKSWNLRYVSHLAEGDEGSCDRPWVRNKSIRILYKLKGLAKLEALLHECTHGGFDMIDEEYVEHWAKDVAKILWEEGFRNE